MEVEEHDGISGPRNNSQSSLTDEVWHCQNALSVLQSADFTRCAESEQAAPARVDGSSSVELLRFFPRADPFLMLNARFDFVQSKDVEM
jgi:hypothetical protein